MNLTLGKRPSCPVQSDAGPWDLRLLCLPICYLPASVALAHLTIAPAPKSLSDSHPLLSKASNPYKAFSSSSLFSLSFCLLLVSIVVHRPFDTAWAFPLVTVTGGHTSLQQQGLPTEVATLVVERSPRRTEVLTPTFFSQLISAPSLMVHIHGPLRLFMSQCLSCLRLHVPVHNENCCKHLCLSFGCGSTLGRAHQK